MTRLFRLLTVALFLTVGSSVVIGATWNAPNLSAHFSAPSDAADHPVAQAAVEECGDLTGDGQTNVFDAIALLQIIVGLVVPTEEQKERGDVAPLGNPDGSIDIFDAILLLQHVVGLVNITVCGASNTPAVITEVSPADGEAMVSTTREARLFR